MVSTVYVKQPFDTRSPGVHIPTQILDMMRGNQIIKITTSDLSLQSYF